MRSRLIIALDFADIVPANKLLEQLNPSEVALKVGNEMFTHYGSIWVKQLVDKGFDVFLDLKYHDIPNTVGRSIAAAADLGVSMINVHASGGIKMMEAAKSALKSLGTQAPLLIAVTVLTSMLDTDLIETGINKPVDDHVLYLANLANEAGLDGVVSSAHEVPQLKSLFGPRFLTVNPGIRLTDNNHHDQARVVTPALALQLGCDYLVVGRPITHASRPYLVVASILETISTQIP